MIEAAILATRLYMLPREKIEREIAYLQIAVDKTAGAAEREAWDWVMEKIAAHLARGRVAPLHPPLEGEGRRRTAPGRGGAAS